MAGSPCKQDKVDSGYLGLRRRPRLRFGVLPRSDTVRQDNHRCCAGWSSGPQVQPPGEWEGYAMASSQLLYDELDNCNCPADSAFGTISQARD